MGDRRRDASGRPGDVANAQIANEPSPLSRDASRSVSAIFEQIVEPSIVVDVSFGDLDVASVEPPSEQR